jgi:RNA polymerase II subunit A-like phosphatase
LFHVSSIHARVRVDVADEIDDFFIGIGDINSSFLPPTPKAPPTTPPPAASPASTAPPLTPEVEATSEEDGLLLQEKLMDDVSEARPLAKLQEELEEKVEAGTSSSDSNKANEGPTNVSKTETIAAGQPGQIARKPLLNNVDNELDRLSRVSYSQLGHQYISADAQILRDIHEQFYDAFDARPGPEIYPLPLGCDVEVCLRSST